MNIPTTGSPTITLFQLRSNYHTILNIQKTSAFKNLKNLKYKQNLYLRKI